MILTILLLNNSLYGKSYFLLKRIPKVTAIEIRVKVNGKLSVGIRVNPFAPSNGKSIITNQPDLLGLKAPRKAEKTKPERESNNDNIYFGDLNLLQWNYVIIFHNFM